MTLFAVQQNNIIGWLILLIYPKEDADEWQILVLSHHPLDWFVESDYVFCYILDAYKNGTSWSNNTISCDFTNKNSAKLIGNIHGHIHNFKTDYIYFDNVNSGRQTSVLRISTPSSCLGRENQYEGVYQDEVTYPKVEDTVEDTSFCIYCIDFDTRKITAICYGAGYDRVISY